MALDFALQLDALSDKENKDAYVIRVEHTILNILDHWGVIRSNFKEGTKEWRYFRDAQDQLFQDAVGCWFHEYQRSRRIREGLVLTDPIACVKDAGYFLNIVLTKNRLTAVSWCGSTEQRIVQLTSSFDLTKGF